MWLLDEHCAEGCERYCGPGLSRVAPLMKTTYERGVEQGMERGLERGIAQGERRSALRLIEAKFGPLSLQVKQQVEALSGEALAQLQIDLLKAQTLEELGLDG